MIGDQIVTDIQFGINCQMTTILVMTGMTTDDMLAGSNVKPDHVIDSFVNCIPL